MYLKTLVLCAYAFSLERTTNTSLTYIHHILDGGSPIHTVYTIYPFYTVDLHMGKKKNTKDKFDTLKLLLLHRIWEETGYKDLLYAVFPYILPESISKV